MLRVQQLREMAEIARNFAAQSSDEKVRSSLIFEAARLEAKARKREVELGLRPPPMQKGED